jgi:hypothetical protein
MDPGVAPQPAAQRLRPPKPETFNGRGRVTRWVFMLLAYFHVVRCDDEQERVNFSVSLLRDSAADWYASQVLAVGGVLPVFPTFGAFADAIRRAFSSIDEPKEAHDRFEAMRQIGSVASYVMAFRQCLLLMQPAVPDDYARRHFIYRLKPEIRSRVEVANPATLEEAMQIAQRIDRSMYSARRDNRPLPFSGHGAGPTPMELGSVKCWNCGQYGHMSRTCRRPRHGNTAGRGNGRGNMNGRGNGGNNRAGGCNQSSN